jgi:hypothetical protein
LGVFEQSAAAFVAYGASLVALVGYPAEPGDRSGAGAVLS